jgi:hypothetical protein
MSQPRSLVAEHACFGEDPPYGLSEQVRRSKKRYRIKRKKVSLLIALAVMAFIGYEMETHGGPVTSGRGAILFFFSAFVFIATFLGGIRSIKKKSLARRPQRLTHD